MAIYNNERLIIKASKMFYNQNLSQKDISEALGISKPQICRMLAYARERQLIKITISDRYDKEFALENELKNKYGLKEVHVFAIEQNGITNKDVFAQNCASVLDKYFLDNINFGVMSGKTNAAIANFVSRQTREGMQFIPLVGSFGSSGNDFHANNIARVFAANAGGTYSLLSAPILVKSSSSCEILRAEPFIADVLSMGKKSNIALVGIGEIGMESTSYKSGAYSIEDIKSLHKEGVIGTICCSYFDKNGKFISTELNERTIGVRMQDLSNCLTITCTEKTSNIQLIDAGLKTGSIKIFMTNVDVASALLKL